MSSSNPMSLSRLLNPFSIEPMWLLYQTQRQKRSVNGIIENAPSAHATHNEKQLPPFPSNPPPSPQPISPPPRPQLANLRTAIPHPTRITRGKRTRLARRTDDRRCSCCTLHEADYTCVKYRSKPVHRCTRCRNAGWSCGVSEPCAYCIDGVVACAESPNVKLVWNGGMLLSGGSSCFAERKPGEYISRLNPSHITHILQRKQSVDIIASPPLSTSPSPLHSLLALRSTPSRQCYATTSNNHLRMKPKTRLNHFTMFVGAI